MTATPRKGSLLSALTLLASYVMLLGVEEHEKCIGDGVGFLEGLQVHLLGNARLTERRPMARFSEDLISSRSVYARLSVCLHLGKEEKPGYSEHHWKLACTVSSVLEQNKQVVVSRAAVLIYGSVAAIGLNENTHQTSSAPFSSLDRNAVTLRSTCSAHLFLTV